MTRAHTTPVLPGSCEFVETQTFPRISASCEPSDSFSTTRAYELPPRRTIVNGPIEVQKITAFQKGWKTLKNYTGRLYDILSDKTRIFISLCRHLEITEDQYHTVFPDILSDQAEDFFMNHIRPDKTWDQIYNLLDSHFNTNVNNAQYWTDWTMTSFAQMRQEHPDKTPQEALETMLDKLQIVQRVLGKGHQGEKALQLTVVRACSGVPEFDHALIAEKPSCEALFAELRAALKVATDRKTASYVQEDMSHNVNYIDQKYHSNRRPNRPQFVQGRSAPGYCPQYRDRVNGFRPHYQNRTSVGKRCFVCKKEGCWSSNHSQEERDRSRRQYLQACMTLGEEEDEQDFEAFLLDFEGETSYDDDDNKEEEDLPGIIAQHLQSSAFLHRTTGEDIYTAEETALPAEQFTLQNQYVTRFQGEMWDTGAARVSTVGKPQVLAFLCEKPDAKVDWTPGSAEIRFGGSQVETSIGTMTMENPLGTVTYHILNTPTPFLLSLHDADRLQAYFNNIANIIVQCDGTTVPVVRKWGHLFFNVARSESGVYLTEPQLCQLHRRFGHPRTERLYNLLKSAGHGDVQENILEQIRKVCHHCQSHDPAPQRFKFSIKDECAFN